MDFTDPIHRKVIGICFIVLSLLGLAGTLFYSYFMDFVFDLAARDSEFPLELSWIFDFIDKFVWAIAILFLIPRMIVGFGLVNQRKWADTPGIVFGVIGLINIPIGTILGIYAIVTLTAKPKDVVFDQSRTN